MPTTANLLANEIKKEIKKDIKYSSVPKKHRNSFRNTFKKEVRYLYDKPEVKYKMTLKQLFNNWIEIVYIKYKSSNITKEEKNIIEKKVWDFYKKLIKYGL